CRARCRTAETAGWGMLALGFGKESDMTARNPHRHTLRALALVLAAGAAGCATQPAAAQPPDRGDTERRPTVTISASADVAVPPDQAVVRLGVLGEGATAADAQTQVNTTMARILDAIERRGIPERSIRTEDLSLYPVYGDQTAPRQGRP